MPISTPTITPGIGKIGSLAIPQTAPAPQAPSTSSNGLDPELQTFTKAIATQEGGGKLLPYDAKGQSGEVGRYQFLPATWKQYAGDVLGDPNAPMTPANQNKVAYSKFAQWKAQGKSYAQIASMWNAGENAPDAYKDNVGTNSNGVKYDTPTYVKNVQKYAQQLHQNSQTPTDDPNQEEKHGLLGGFLSAALKTPARLATNLINAGQEITGNDPTEPFSGKFLGEVKPIGNSGNFGQDLKESLGAGAELSSYLVGGDGLAGIGENTLKGLIKESAIQSAKTGLVAGTLGGAGNAAANNGSAGQIVGQGILGGVTGAATGGLLGAGSPLLAKGLNKVTGAFPEITNIKNTAALSDLSDRISPKPTISEVRLAQDQGRIVEGKPAGIFTEGTGQTITPTSKVQQAANTVNKYIPNNADLSNSELSTALKGKVGDIAEELKPQMEKVPIDPETVRKINTDLADTQKAQTKLGDTPDSKAIIKKYQSDFQETIKGTKGGNMNDLWETAKTYDDSIPSNVKNAHANSPESLQLKKQLWLQNRGIIKDAINDTSFGLGKTSKQAFSDMSDMYEAQKGLRSRAKLNPPQASKLSQAYNSTTGKIIRKTSKLGLIGAGLYGGYEGAKHLGL